VLVGFKPYLQDQLVSFSALTLLWPVKIVPDMTYNVFGGTLNLAQSIDLQSPLIFHQLLETFLLINVNSNINCVECWRLVISVVL